MSDSTPIAPDLDSISLQRLMASLSLLQINYNDEKFSEGRRARSARLTHRTGDVSPRSNFTVFMDLIVSLPIPSMNVAICGMPKWASRAA